MNRRSTDPPYWPAPAVEERLTRVEERLSNLIDRLDRTGRQVRWWAVFGVTGAGAVGALLAAMVR